MHRSHARRSSGPRSALLVVLVVLLGSALWLPPAAQGAGLDPAFGPTRNLWIDRDLLRSRPMSGEAWERLAEDARGSWGSANIADQDSDHDVLTLAGALYAVRRNDVGMRSRVVSAIESAIGTERGGRTLALGRNLTGYVLAADLVGYDSLPFRSWLTGVRTAALDRGTLVETHETRPNNWGTHAGAARIAADLFLGDTADLDRAVRVFRGFLGDRSAYRGFSFGDDTWQANPSAPVPINPAGSTKNGIVVDGAIVDDIRRCECPVQSPAPQENYQWEAMQGIVTQATLLQAAGYTDVWNWSDAAIQRAIRFLYEQARFPAEADDTVTLFLIDAALGTTLSAGEKAGNGKSIRYTDFTHPTGSAATTRSGTIPGINSVVRTTDPMRYVPTEQSRLFDTRTAEAPSGRLSRGQTLHVQVGGRAGVPSGAGAVVLNVTATNSPGPGYVTVWPYGDPRPATSSLNLTGPGEVVPNLVVVPLGDGGKVSFFTEGELDLLADVNGYFVADDDARDGRFVPLEPSRAFDTRDAAAPSGALGPDATLSMRVAGRNGIPASGASVAVINVTAIGQGARGYVTTYAHGVPRPFASSLNIDGAGSIRSNLVFAPIGADGRVDFFTSTRTHLVADVVGYFTDDSASRSTTGMFVASSSIRHVDTRFGLPGGARRLGAGQDAAYAIGGNINVPADGAAAVLTNVTATNAGPGYLTTWGTGDGRPLASTVNLDGRGKTRSNAAVIELGSQRRVSVYTYRDADVIVDVFGYFTD